MVSIDQNMPFDTSNSFDYSYVSTPARIALYDSLAAAPRITVISPAPTAEFIEALASKTYEQAQLKGSEIPYTVIREVSENFIHARFNEVVVSIFNNGNTIRFADQGPGIEQKDKAQLPGFTSAVEPMKPYIRGVGSGLPIVKEYLQLSHGTITIEDNLTAGAVVTINITDEVPVKKQKNTTPYYMPPLSKKEKEILPLFLSEGALGITDIKELTGMANSSIHNILKKLEEEGLIENTVGHKRILTELGYDVTKHLEK